MYPRKCIFRIKDLLFFFFLSLLFSNLPAQPRYLSLKDVLLQIDSQPLLNVYKQKAESVRYNTDLAKNTLMPDLEAGYQAGIATHNNITGMSYPGLIMPISGPPSASNSYQAVPGTALALLLKWSPFTFGQRSAATDKAAAAYKLANSEYNEVLFKQQYAALTTYIDIVYYKKILESLQDDIDRVQADLDRSLVLTGQGLRAGIDSVQLQAQAVQARIDYLNTQKLYRDRLIELTRLLNLSTAPEHIVLTDTAMSEKVPVIADTVASFTANPIYQYFQNKKELSVSNLTELNRAWRPKLDIWANAYSRGSGVAADGTVDASKGWSLSRNNYGAGLQLSFPILQFSKLNIQKKQAQSLIKADEAQLSQVALDISKQIETARSNYRQNAAVAALTPEQVNATRLVYESLQEGYKSGLTDYTRLVQGRYDYLKAEITNAGAHVQVWYSLLDIAIAQGELKVFTDQLK
jgi:outer membrane protein TolC